MLSVEKVTTSEGFKALEPAWNKLLQQSPSNNVTLTFEWLSTWWEVFNEGRELYLVVVRDGAEIIGIAPLLKQIVQRYGLLPFRRLEFLASGEAEADEICSDYLDFILKSGREKDALDAILRFLHKEEDWDEIVLSDLLGESVSLEALKKICERRETTVETVKSQISIYLPLGDSFDEIVKKVSSNFRRRIKQDRRTFTEYGGEIRIVECLEEFEEAFARLMDLHEARWTARGEPGVFSSEKFRRFHRLLAPKAIANGWLRIYFAERQGKPFAAIYNFNYNDKAYYYQSGLRIAESGLLSPGVLLQGYAIEDSIRRGLREYDFLKGERDSYKFKWTQSTRSIVKIRLAQLQTKEKLYQTTSRFLDGLRSIKKNLSGAAAS